MNTIERIEQARKAMPEPYKLDRFGTVRGPKGEDYRAGDKEGVDNPLLAECMNEAFVAGMDSTKAELAVLREVARAAREASKLCWGAINQATVKQTVEGQPFSAATCHAAQMLDAALAALKENANG